MNAYTIPIAFLVEGDDEMDAARALVRILVDSELTQDHRARSVRLPPSLGPIESWWLPNHPVATMQDDSESVLVFAPNTTASLGAEELQRYANNAVRYWRKIIEESDGPDDPVPTPSRDDLIAAFSAGLNYTNAPDDFEYPEIDARSMAYDFAAGLSRRIDDGEF